MSGQKSSPTQLNLTEIVDIVAGEDLFIVEVYGRVASCVARDSISVTHADVTFRGRI